MLQKNEPRPDANSSLFPCQEALGQAATIKNSNSNQTIVRTQAEAIARNCSKLNSNFSIGLKIGFENLDWAEKLIQNRTLFVFVFPWKMDWAESEFLTLRASPPAPSGLRGVRLKTLPIFQLGGFTLPPTPFPGTNSGPKWARKATKSSKKSNKGTTI